MVGGGRRSWMEVVNIRFVCIYTGLENSMRVGTSYIALEGLVSLYLDR